MPKFKACPFCGANPLHGLTKVEYDQLHGEPFQRFRIHCPKGHATVTAMSESIATDEWNGRHEIADKLAEVMVSKGQQDAYEAAAQVMAAREAYNRHTDNHPTIHSNRFPAWEELSAAERRKWIEGA